MPRLQRSLSLFRANCLTLPALLLLTGCHSAFVQTSVINQSGQPIHLFEVDYPTASFGGQELAPGATFHYRFKILGDGPTKLLWTDAAQHDHTSTGPNLQQGQEGTLAISIGQASATWNPRLTP